MTSLPPGVFNHAGLSNLQRLYVVQGASWSTLTCSGRVLVNTPINALQPGAFDSISSLATLYVTSALCTTVASTSRVHRSCGEVISIHSIYIHHKSHSMTADNTGATRSHRRRSSQETSLHRATITAAIPSCSPLAMFFVAVTWVATRSLLCLQTSWLI